MEPVKADSVMIEVTKKLKFDFKSQIGQGTFSTVYKGTFEDIPVAVKVIKCKNAEDAENINDEFERSRERKIMNAVETERHRNIIGYYVSEIQNEQMYLAIELCNGNLADYVKSKTLKASFPPMKVNFEIASGVEFLHSKKIVHRDLKPENVYFVTNADKEVTRIVIGDFGTSKWTVDGCFSMTAGGTQGTCGYIAHEVWKYMQQSDDMNHRNKTSEKSDIFALGCVFYFTLSNGNHPFGNPISRQSNIQQKNPPNVDGLEPWQDPTKQLLVRMLNHDPDKRPTSQDVIEHPALWSSERIITFFTNVSNELQNVDGATRLQLEDPDVIWRGNWDINLPVNLKSYLDNYSLSGRYIYRENRWSVCGLLRIIRNIAGHYKQFPPDIRRELGDFPEGHVELWMKLCPLLLMHVYRKVEELQLPGVVDQASRMKTPTGSHARAPAPIENIRPAIRPVSFQPQGEDIAMESPRITNNRLPFTASTREENIRLESRPVSFQPQGEAISAKPPQLTSRKPFTDSAHPSHSFSENLSKSHMGSLNEGVTQLAIESGPENGSSDHRRSQDAKSFDIPEIVKQPQSFYLPEASHWNMFAQQEIENAKQCVQRDLEGKSTILCLDISESMAKGEAWMQVKRFVRDVINGLNGLTMLLGERQLEYISIATFGHETKVIQRLSNNCEELRASFDRIKLGGPSPMYGGFMLAAAAILAVERQRGKPTIALISDFRPTKTTRNAGPDVPDENSKDEISSHMIEVLTQFSSNINIVFIPVGDVDKVFLQLLVDVTTGTSLSYENGRELVAESLRKESGVSSRDMYKEITDPALPTIGSRVVRGPEWKFDNQDSNGPGTVIGHGEGCSVWVEWDANGHQNVYQYGFNGFFHVLLTDHRREISPYGTLNVGCIVTHANGYDKGVVIKVIGNGKVHVRWENGTRGDYGFGNDVYEVWPWSPTDEVPRTEDTVVVRDMPTTSAPRTGTQHQQTQGAIPKKRINKNLHPGRGGRR